ncbi:MAG TPA: hypothetical protein IAB15_00640 [Candidatus Ornithoclostridium faecigallinarum]|nr:hypothetical protein [Candidatus Ornithoclostridium faecigallinarum]
MRKGLALTTVFMAIVIAVVIVASTFAFFSNVPDKTVVTIGANDDFSISLGDAVGTAQLFPQTPVSNNSGGVSGEKKFASVTIEYTVAVEGAASITLRVSDSYAWTGVDADVQDYVNSHIKCRLYAVGGQPLEWGAAGAAEYKLPVITPGATGKVTLDVMLDISEELAPPELKGATLTVRVGVEKTTSGESA